MQLEFLICKTGLNIYLTELLRKLNDINGVKYSPQGLNKYKLLLLVTTTIRERYKNQNQKYWIDNSLLICDGSHLRLPSFFGNP